MKKMKKTTLQPIITENLSKIREICEKHKIKRLSVFGSACTEAFSDESDVDLLYEFEDFPPEEFFDYFEPLVLEMRQLFDKKVDFVAEKKLSNPYFIRQIERTKELIYERQREQ